MLVHEELGPSFAWMGNLAALKAKLREIGYDGDEDRVVGGVISAEVIVHLPVADMHIDYDAALLVVQSLKAHQYGDLVSRTELFIKDAQQLYIFSIASRCVCVCGRCVCVCGWCVCVCGRCVCVCGRCVYVCFWSCVY